MKRRHRPGILASAGAAAMLVVAVTDTASAQSFDLASPDGLVLHNVVATPVTLHGKSAIRVTLAPGAQPPATQRKMPSAAGGAAAVEANRVECLAIVPSVELRNGTIEVDLAGEPAVGASGGARGFVGVAFRVQPDRDTYDAFYVRPTNGRAEDPERRKRTLQYVSHPDWPWYRLRQETPGRYESHADVAPGQWIHLRIEIDGVTARLFVDGAERPSLLVDDVKSGAGAAGQVALWIEGSTVAHFANLKITTR